MFSQESQFNPTANKINLDQLKEFGIYPLADIELSNLEENNSITNSTNSTNQTNLSIREIILRLINSNDEAILRKIAEEIDPKFINERDPEVLKNSILEYLNRSTQRRTTTGPSPEAGRSINELGEEEIFPPIETSGVILKKTDLIKLSEIEVENKKHNTVVLEGNVEIEYQNGNIVADIITINLDTREIFAEGEVKVTIGDNVIQGESGVFKLREERGYINNAYGIQQGNYFRVETFRINSNDHFSLENGWVTFSRNDDPFYHIYFDKVDIYGREKDIFINPVVTVHNHGFLWIPFFNRYPLSSSLDVSFGVNRREGFYLLTKTGFNLPLLKKLDVKFNIYEKLGFYLNLLNESEIVGSNYKLDFTGVYYTENSATKENNKLTYTHNTSPYINSKNSFRYKVAYEHIFQLLKTDNNISSRLKLSLNNTSDPLLVDNFKNSLDLDHLDIRRLIERHDRDEQLYRLPNNPSDNDFYKVSQTFTAQNTSLTVNLDWIYGIYDEKNVTDNFASIDERYTKYLQSVTLPSVTFRHSGTIDPNMNNELLHFNIRYNLGLNYLAKSTFKDGSPINTGGGTVSQVPPYSLLKEVYTFGINAGINRPFSFDKDQYSLLNFEQDWFFWDLTPSFGVNYNRNWQGRNFTTENNPDTDKSILKLNYRLNSSIDFLGSISTFTSFKVNNNWGLTDETTTINSPFLENSLSTSENKIRKISSTYSFSLPFSFPSTRLKNTWARSTGLESMIPSFSYDFTYRVNKRTSEEIVNTKPLELDLIDRRDFSTSLSGLHRGFGFLYIPNLNYTLTSKISFSYDLLPILDEERNVISDNFFTDSRFWQESRIKSFAGSSSWNFNLNLSPVQNSLNNSLSYNFFDKVEKKVVNELIKYSLSYKFSLRIAERNNIVDLNNFSLGYNFNYFYQERDYLNDSMSFNLNLSLRIINLFNFVFQFSASNPESHLYFTDKARALDQEPVNFFEDLVDSLGINGLQKQRESLFKLRSISFSLEHDVDDWQARFSYTFIPRSFVEDSFRGFYYDHVLSFNINLKPEKDPRGPAIARTDPFFDNIERVFTPTGF